MIICIKDLNTHMHNIINGELMDATYRLKAFKAQADHLSQFYPNTKLPPKDKEET